MSKLEGLRSAAQAAAFAAALCTASSAHAQTAADLAKLSIEELANYEVTSVSKRAERLGDAPSSIFVISHEDILRSGATSVPEVLRLAPNLQVTQAGSSRYVITARGFNGAPAAQNFSNKLLVLIDGRTVYSPLFSGVYWDMQDVMLSDVDRIEVISGPGATLWGANAVNGVINIITRGSDETQGGLLRVGAGDRERAAGVRYGGHLAENLTYRLYAKSFFRADAKLPSGADAHDHWSKPQAGFRLDWTPSPSQALTLQGDAHTGAEAQAGAPAEEIRGHNLTARWTRTRPSGATLQVQAYYDHVRRGGETSGSGFTVDTYDLDLQHAFQVGARHALVWGAGYRLSRYDIAGSPALFWVPPTGDLKLYNLFVQDTVTLSPALDLVLGAKLEDDPYVDPELLPNVRVAWTPNGKLTVWGAASRAVHSATPFDRDVVERVGGQVFLIGGGRFQSEKLTAYELGAKIRPSPRASLTLSGYYNDYDDLRSIERAPGGFLPLRWGNGMAGRTYGLEAWGDYQLTSWWRLSGSVSYLEEAFRFKPGASGLVGLQQAANDPKYQAALRSWMTFQNGVTADTALRYVGGLPNPRLPDVLELDARLGVELTEDVRLSISGRNLLHDQHAEYIGGAEIPRSVFVDLSWRF